MDHRETHLHTIAHTIDRIDHKCRAVGGSQTDEHNRTNSWTSRGEMSRVGQCRVPFNNAILTGNRFEVSEIKKMKEKIGY